MGNANTHTVQLKFNATSSNDEAPRSRVPPPRCVCARGPRLCRRTGELDCATTMFPAHDPLSQARGACAPPPGALPHHVPLHSPAASGPGESAWNAGKRFSGWVDMDLSPRGEEEATAAGLQIRAAGLRFDEAHTSFLKRSTRTLSLVRRLLPLGGGGKVEEGG